MYRIIFTFFLLIGMELIFFQSVAKENPAQMLNYEVKSPDGNYTVIFSTTTSENNELQLSYRVSYKGKAIVEKSALDIVLDNHISELSMAIKPDVNFHFAEDMNFISRKDTSVDTTWNNTNVISTTQTDAINISDL